MILVALAALAASPALIASTTTTIVAVERRTIVRVPARRRRGVVPPPPLPDFKSSRGPHCVSSTDISAAAVTGPAQVDFVLKGGQRIRAELEDACPALDFYGGFYLSPSADGRICADRDAIRTRAGGECGIDRFRKLTPKPPAKP